MMTVEKTRFTCPDCGGALEKIEDGHLMEYRCRVGHTYSSLTAFTTHHDREENTVWLAVVLLEEGAEMAEEVAGVVDGELSKRLAKAEEAKRRWAARIREIALEFPGTFQPRSRG